MYQVLHKLLFSHLHTSKIVTTKLKVYIYIILTVEMFRHHCVCLQGKWEVPLPKVKGMSENEVFKVVKTGKTRSKLTILICAHIFTYLLQLAFIL